jgi:hypothetical protein
MSLSEQYNIGARITAKLASTSLSIAQTSAAAATTQDGLTIDRNESGFKRFYSAKAIAAFSFTAASSNRTATIGINFQHSSDGTSWDNYSTATVPTAVTFGSTAATASTDYDTVEQSVNLNGARRYVRVQIPAPTYSDCSSGQGVFSGSAVIVFGGGDELVAR